MPSDTRDTVRRNFSINREASQAIDSFADEHNLTKSKVVERAVMEYTTENRTARIEKKVDKILSSIDGGNVSLAQTGEKKKNSQSDSTDFDPAGYDPDEERDKPLSKDELKELIKIDELVVNPEHIEEDNLPGSTREKTALLAAVVRCKVRDYDSNTFNPEHVKEAIKEHLGDSDYMLEQYFDPVKNEFELEQTIRFNRDKGQYESYTSNPFPTESHRQEHYQERYETIKEAIDTPIDELPDFSLLPKPYEFLRQWLDNYWVSEILQELEIATSDEIDELQEELLDCRDNINQCLVAIKDTRRYGGDFSRQEAIEAVPYDEEQSESIVSLLDNVDYIREYHNHKDMGLDDDRVVWWD